MLIIYITSLVSLRGSYHSVAVSVVVLSLTGEVPKFVGVRAEWVDVKRFMVLYDLITAYLWRFRVFTWLQLALLDKVSAVFIGNNMISNDNQLHFKVLIHCFSQRVYPTDLIPYWNQGHATNWHWVSHDFVSAFGPSIKLFFHSVSWWEGSPDCVLVLPFDIIWLIVIIIWAWGATCWGLAFKKPQSVSADIKV